MAPIAIVGSLYANGTVFDCWPRVFWTNKDIVLANGWTGAVNVITVSLTYTAEAMFTPLRTIFESLSNPEPVRVTVSPPEVDTDEGNALVKTGAAKASDGWERTLAPRTLKINKKADATAFLIIFLIPCLFPITPGLTYKFY